jgi:phenylacetic acid degradation operon negative regulatory protein
MIAARPQDLVWTLYGEFLLHEREPIWVGSLIRLLEPLGVAEGHARTVLSRMTAKGWLDSMREGKRAYYALSGRGRLLLEEGEARIYRPERVTEWDGQWTLLAYSIPEEQRSIRDRLRTRLSWLGFGSLGNGLWVTPHDVRDRVREVSEELGVVGHLQVFRGSYAGYSTPADLVSQCWDLPGLNVRFEAFVNRHLDACMDLMGGDVALSPRDAYVRRFELVHEYREFPLLDPYLPRPLQPDGWAAECAQALLQKYRTLLSEAADQYLESQLERLEEEERRPALR